MSRIAADVKRTGASRLAKKRSRHRPCGHA